MRQSLRSSCARARGPDPALATKSTLTTVSREGGHKGWGCHHSHHVAIPLQAYSCDTTYVAGRLYQAPFGDSTGSLHSVAKSQHSYIPFVCRYGAGGGPCWGHAHTLGRPCHRCLAGRTRG